MFKKATLLKIIDKYFSFHKTTLLIFLIILCLQPANSQNYYNPIKSYQIIPEDFIQQLKYSSYKDNIDTDLHRKERKIQEDFSQFTNSTIEYLYRSGRIYFNNELQEYLTQIKDYVLKDYPEIQKQVNIYLINKIDYNACTLSNGDILINTELLSKINNEAQLAYIICHEIVHFLKKHHLKSYKKILEVKDDKHKYKQLNYDERLLVFTSFSCMQEREADSLGFAKFYSKTNYDVTQSFKTFEGIFYSILPISSDVISLDFFENELFILPDEFNLVQLDSIPGFESGNDSISTHPDLKKRESSLIELVKNTDNSGKLEYVISEKRFKEIKKIAEFEFVKILIQDQQYERAIVNSIYLLNKYPNANFLKLNIALALLEISIYKNNRDFYAIEKDIKTTYGECQRINYLFNEIDKEQMAVFVFAYLWNLKSEYQEDVKFEAILKYSIKNLLDNFKVLNANGNTLANEQHSGGDSHLDFLSKVSEEPEFQKILASLVDERNKKQEELEALLKDPKKRKQILKENKDIKKHGFSLGIDKIVITNPMSVTIDYHNAKVSDDLEQSRDSRKGLIDCLKSNGKNLGLEIELLDISEMQQSDADKYNDYCVSSDWFFEKCSHPQESYFNSCSLYSNYLAEKYGTRYFAWVGLLNYKDSGALNSDRSALYLHLFDIVSGETILAQNEWFPSIIDEMLMDKMIFKILNQIKRTSN